jgi:hypothetical protein
MTGETVTVGAGRGRGRIAERIAALAGATSVVVTVAGASIGDTGGKGIDPTMGPEGILRGVEPLVGQLQISASLFSVAAVFLLVFLGPLWRRLRTSAEWVAVVGVSGGVVAASLITGYVHAALAMATAADLGDGTTAQVLTTSGWETARVLAVPFLVMVAAAVVAGSTPGVLPPWFRWFSVVMLAPLVVALTPVGPAGVLGLSGMLCVFVASLMLAVEAQGRSAP